MKKNVWASIHKLLKMGLLSYLLLLSTRSGITGVTVTHATSSRCGFCTPTPTATAAPTPTATTAPTPTATQPPTATPSPQVQPNPTKVVVPVSTITAETPTPATPTSTPASATTTAATVTPDQTAMTSTDATPANQQSQGAGDAGFNMFVMPLSIGVPLFLFSGAILWLLWRRQTSQPKPALQGISRNGQAPRWISSREMQSNLETSQYASSDIFASGVSGASGGAEVFPMLGSTQPNASSAIFAPGVLGASGGVEVFPMLGSTQPILSSQPAYASSDLHPMLTTFPQQTVTQSSNNAVSYPQNGILQSLLMDSINLPSQLTAARDSNTNGQMLLLATAPTALMDTPALSMSPPPLVSAVRPPSIGDDPMLEVMMRQAQTGLFALTGR
ncbi:MAG TPA: hypothetical protein VN207_11430 [Ktedonobacteraceae bacterium]|nr:hypothetical protein [Ktedonobacteraceae bacterium]